MDPAKSVFQLVVAHDDWRAVESHRLTRRHFETFFNNRAVSLVIMEACGSAYYRAPWLEAATLAAKADRSLDALRQWAVNIRARTHHSKVACALANKLARICYSVLRDATAYGEPQPRLARKADRASFAVAA